MGGDGRGGRDQVGEEGGPGAAALAGDDGEGGHGRGAPPGARLAHQVWARPLLQQQPHAAPPHTHPNIQTQ
eukprot:1475841-Rhodomonas_salina.1